MKTKTSKSQLEVWEWKELLYEEIKNLPNASRIDYILQKVGNTLKELSKKENNLK